MAKHYYIDGYNVMHKSSVLRPLARSSFEAARDALVEKVSAFCVALDCRATLVFDGRGRRLAQRVEHPNGIPTLEVLYSPTDISADAVIERRVYQSSKRLDVVVVSNDRGLRDLCRNMGALTMEADHFLASVSEVRADTSNAVRNLSRNDRPAWLSERLGDGQLARLEALREKLAKR